METIEKDILTVEEGVICHQVNCFGVMGAGLALDIKKKWQVVYREYHKKSQNFTPDPSKLLGQVQFIQVNNRESNTRLIVANLFAQKTYGTVKKCYTDYTAFRICLENIPEWVIKGAGNKIYFPYKIGCGLAGGDWEMVSSIIEDVFPNAIICRRKL